MRMILDRRETRDLHFGGFTLVELLVVVSIICLLVSLSLPALTQAQRQAEQVHCLANQHQLMLAWFLYAPDHDDKLCDPQSWVSALETYTQTKEVFACKTQEGDMTCDSYGMSNTMGGEDRDGVKPFARLHTVSHPSARMVVVDKERLGSDCFWPLLWDANDWVWRPWSWPPGLQGMTNRHRNGCNLSFADGHGEWIHWKDDRTRRLISGLIADADEASEDNPDLEYMVRVLAGSRSVHDKSGD